MNQIPIDRDLLQRILDAYFDLDADNRAYFGIWQEMKRNGSDQIQRQLDRYNDEVQKEKAKELDANEGLRTAVAGKVQTEADASFLSRLIPRFAPS